MIAAGVLILAQAASAGPSPAYRELIDRYRRGDRAAAVGAPRTQAQLRAAREAVERLAQAARSCGGCPAREEWEAFPFEAAILLHTDRAAVAAARAEGTEMDETFHAVGLARLMPAERRRAFVPRWLAALVLRSCREGRWTLAFGLLNEAEGGHDDAELALLRGAVIESRLDMAPRLRGAEILGAAESADLTWAGAEALYRRALAAHPDLVEARLRLGRVRQVTSRGRDVAALQAVADGPATPAQRYMAHLFLGAAREQRGDYAEAAREFEQAVAVFPHAQSAAVALSHARRRSGRWDAAVGALRAGLGTPGEREPVDPWWAYQAGQAEDADAVLDALRAEVLK